MLVVASPPLASIHAHSAAVLSSLQLGHLRGALRSAVPSVKRDFTLDLDEHQSTWRFAGWTGHTGSMGMAMGLTEAVGLAGSSSSGTSASGAGATLVRLASGRLGALT